MQKSLIDTIACGVAACVALLASVAVVPSPPLALLIAAAVSATGTVLCITGWKPNGLLDLGEFRQLGYLAVVALLIVLAMFVMDSFLVDLNPVRIRDWGTILEKSGAFGFVLTAGGAGVAAFCLVATGVRLLIRRNTPAARD